MGFGVWGLGFGVCHMLCVHHHARRALWRVPRFTLPRPRSDVGFTFSQVVVGFVVSYKCVVMRLQSMAGSQDCGPVLGTLNVSCGLIIVSPKKTTV